MAASSSSRPRLGNDRWSLFLRQKHLQDQLRRLRNDFKHCDCPPQCLGATQIHVPVDPASSSAHTQPMHGPYVAADSEMPRTRARPKDRRHPNLVVMAEARGISDILLYRGRIRATLRMSLQVYEDPIPTGRRGYFGEMFLTRSGQEEEFIGFIHAWQVSRTSDDWVDLLLGEFGESFDDDTSIWDMRNFFSRLYARTDLDERIFADRDGNILPRPPLRQDFAASWARLNNNNDFVYIPMIWLDDSVCTTLAFRFTLPNPQKSSHYIKFRPLNTASVPGYRTAHRRPRLQFVLQVDGGWDTART